jgi:hypothetical protein
VCKSLHRGYPPPSPGTSAALIGPVPWASHGTRGGSGRAAAPGGGWEGKRSGPPLWRFGRNSRKETMRGLCAVPRRLAARSPQKPLMSWAWNAGREEGRSGFGEGDASHLFPRPKVRNINPTHSSEQWPSCASPNSNHSKMPPASANKPSTKATHEGTSRDRDSRRDPKLHSSLNSAADAPPKAGRSGFVSDSCLSTAHGLPPLRGCGGPSAGHSVSVPRRSRGTMRAGFGHAACTADGGGDARSERSLAGRRPLLPGSLVPQRAKDHAESPLPGGTRPTATEGPAARGRPLRDSRRRDKARTATGS